VFEEGLERFAANDDETPMVIRRVLPLLLASSLAFAACGNDDSVDNQSDRTTDIDRDDPDNARRGDVIVETVGGARGKVLAAAVDSTSDGTAKMSMTMEMGSLVSISMEGSLDFESREGSFVMDMGDMGGLLGDELGDDELVIEMRMVDGFVYMKMPAMMRGALGGGDAEWIGVDIEAALAATDLPDETLASLQQQADPSAYLSFLRAVSNDVEEVGVEEIRGEMTTHYEGTLDMAKAFDELPDEVQDVLDEELGDNASSQFAEVFEQMGLDEIPFDVWIDSENRLRKLSMELDMSELLEAAGDSGELFGFDGEVSMSFELYDYGSPIDVEAPPNDDVEIIDLDDLESGEPPTKFSQSDSALR
jgi:hypothetical protein